MEVYNWWKKYAKYMYNLIHTVRLWAFIHILSPHVSSVTYPYQAN